MTALLILLTCKVALTAATPINTPTVVKVERKGLPMRELQVMWKRSNKDKGIIKRRLKGIY